MAHIRTPIVGQACTVVEGSNNEKTGKRTPDDIGPIDGEGPRVTAVPIAAASLSKLRKSGTQIERRAAAVLASHFRASGSAYEKGT